VGFLRYILSLRENLSSICDNGETKCNSEIGSFCVKYGDQYECRCDNGYFGRNCEYCNNIYSKNK
jgi:hypothetical protein